jgi:hypothetical protein
MATKYGKIKELETALNNAKKPANSVLENTTVDALESPASLSSVESKARVLKNFVEAWMDSTYHDRNSQVERMKEIDKIIADKNI